MSGSHVLYVHFHRHPGAAAGAPGVPEPPDAPGPHGAPDTDPYQELLGLLTEVTPVVQALPPDAALADVRGALRYFDRDATRLAEMIRVRALARHGADCTIGVAANPLLARMTAQDGPPGAVRTLPADPAAVTAFLRDKPVTALPGVGPATARTLAGYGLDTLGRVTATPLATLQRILGATAARRLHAHAQGVDPTPVVPRTPPRSLGAEHLFDHDELDAHQRRRALLTLADRLGHRLRTERQVARALTLTVRYADRTTTVRRRTLPEPSAHTPDLTALAYALHDALGLQRARVRALALRAEDLTDAAHATHQLSLDPRDEKARRAEAAADRARARFGHHAAGPAGTLHDAA